MTTGPLTPAEVAEIQAHAADRKAHGVQIDLLSDLHGGMIMQLPLGSVMHPRTFLDIIHAQQDE